MFCFFVVWVLLVSNSPFGPSHMVVVALLEVHKWIEVSVQLKVHLQYGRCYEANKLCRFVYGLQECITSQKFNVVFLSLG
jgi:hypothetical protein